MRISAGDLIVWLGFVILTGCSSEVVTKPVELVWPNPPQTPRIKYLGSLSRADEFNSGRSWLEQLIPEKRNTSALRKPYGVTTDREGRVYVADTGQAVVWVFDQNRKKTNVLGASMQGRLSQPVGVAVNNRGTVFISDINLKRVYGFNPEGQLVLALGQKNELDTPSGLAVDSVSARLYVADSRRHKVRVYSYNDGRFLFEFGQMGSKDGEFNFPTNLFIRSGKIYVSDSVNSRVQILDLDGNFLKKFGSLGNRPGRLARPRGVAVDSEGQIYVADALLNNLQVFDEEGKLLFYFGAMGDRPGYFALPAGIHIDEDDKVYIVDSFNRRVQLFQYLGQKYYTKLSKLQPRFKGENIGAIAGVNY